MDLELLRVGMLGSDVSKDKHSILLRNYSKEPLARKGFKERLRYALYVGLAGWFTKISWAFWYYTKPRD